MSYFTLDELILALFKPFQAMIDKRTRRLYFDFIPLHLCPHTYRLFSGRTDCKNNRSNIFNFERIENSFFLPWICSSEDVALRWRRLTDESHTSFLPLQSDLDQPQEAFYLVIHIHQSKCGVSPVAGYSVVLLHSACISKFFYFPLKFRDFK